MIRVKETAQKTERDRDAVEDYWPVRVEFVPMPGTDRIKIKAGIRPLHSTFDQPSSSCMTLLVQQKKLQSSKSQSNVDLA